MSRTRIRTHCLAVLAACVLSACASSHIDTSGAPPTDITSAHIERTYALLNASPFAITTDGATAQELYGDLTHLSPDPGQSACPGDTAVHYTIVIDRGSKRILKAEAIYGGCRVVVMGGSSFSAEGAAGTAFWKALFAAVGPAGKPDAGTGSSGSAS